MANASWSSNSQQVSKAVTAGMGALRNSAISASYCLSFFPLTPDVFVSR